MPTFETGRREHNRFSLMGSLPGIFKNADLTVEVLPVDVSSIGIGLLIDPSPNPGDVIKWDCPSEGEIKLITIWSKEAEAGTSFDEFSKMRRCGLVLDNEKFNLLEICKKHESLQIVE